MALFSRIAVARIVHADEGVTVEIGLGTAQFGMPYGAVNCTGRVPNDEQRRILSHFFSQGLRYVDTASSYGNAEQSLGDSLVEARAVDLRLITKVQACSNEISISEQVRRSLRHLKQSNAYGVLIHDFSQLENSQFSRIRDEFMSLCDEGLVTKFGASLYEPEELGIFLEQNMGNIVQVPVNVLDQRFLSSGMAEIAQSAGIEVHGRSLFLQGLLVSEKICPIPELVGAVREFHEWSVSLNMSPLEACFAFAKSTSTVDVWILGVDNFVHLSEHLSVFQEIQKNNVEFDFSRLALDEGMLDPRKWCLPK